MADVKVHPLQRAWLSGVVDSRQALPKTGYTIRIESTDEPLITRISETVGFGRLWNREKKGQGAIIYSWYTTNMDDTRTFLLLIAPFLSVKKTKEASKIIAKIERNEQWRKKNPEKMGGLVTEPVKDANHQTQQQDTQVAGLNASHVEKTTEPTTTTLDQSKVKL